MIENPRVLEREFIPDQDLIVHRDGQLDALSAALQPLQYGGRPDDVFLYGPSGAGKSCLAQYTLGKLHEELLDVNTHYIDCWNQQTRFKLLYEALAAVGSTADIHRQSTPKDTVIDRLRETADTPYVIVLDEADQLVDPDALRDIWALPHTTMILIANREEDLFSGLDPRIDSRLRGGPQIQFDRYSDDQLVDILRARATHGLVPNAVTDAHLADIASAAAGDARIALTIFRQAVRRADHEGRSQIEERDIEPAVASGREVARDHVLERLDDHQRELYEIIRNESPVPGGEALYERYRELVENPRGDRTVRNYLNKLEEYHLIEQIGSTSDTRYRALGDPVGQPCGTG